MAFVNARLAAYDDERCTVTIRYNDANGAVASVTVQNGSTLVFWWRVWLIADPAVRVEGTVPPGQSITYPVTGNIRYSPVELPEGDPAATNWNYDARVG